MTRTIIGIITKPQALKGEFRVKPQTNISNLINDIKVVFIDDAPYEVQKITNRITFLIFKIKGIDDCNAAENLRNKEISINSDVVKEINKEELVISDLIGLEVVNEDSIHIGLLKDINQFGAADIFVVENEDREMMFPYARNVVSKIDFENKKIIVNQKILDEMKV